MNSYINKLIFLMMFTSISLYIPSRLYLFIDEDIKHRYIVSIDDAVITKNEMIRNAIKFAEKLFIGTTLFFFIVYFTNNDHNKHLFMFKDTLVEMNKDKFETIFNTSTNEWEKVYEYLLYTVWQVGSDESKQCLIKQGNIKDFSESSLIKLTKELMKVKNWGILTNTKGVLANTKGVLTNKEGILTNTKGVLTNKEGLLKKTCNFDVWTSTLTNSSIFFTIASLFLVNAIMFFSLKNTCFLNYEGQLMLYSNKESIRNRNKEKTY